MSFPKTNKTTNAAYEGKAQEAKVQEAGATIGATVEAKPITQEAAGSVSSYIEEKREAKNVRLNLLVKPSVKKRLDKVTKANNISLNALVNAAILKALDEYEK